MSDSGEDYKSEVFELSSRLLEHDLQAVKLCHEAIVPGIIPQPFQ